MPIDLHDSVKSCSNWAFGSDALNSILGSSLFVAILISIVMMLIVMIFYPAKRGTGFGTVAKMGLYMFFTTLMIVFLHDSVLKYILEDKTTVVNNDDFMRGVTRGGSSVVYAGEHMPTHGAYEPAEPQIVHTGDDDDGSEASYDGGEDEPAYGGSVVTNPGHGVLGGGRPPPKAGNPYR